ncbi:hypothetical protein BH23ACT10_BH23ACT10_11330 [soil metagenome]
MRDVRLVVAALLVLTVLAAGCAGASESSPDTRLSPIAASPVASQGQSAAAATPSETAAETPSAATSVAPDEVAGVTEPAVCSAGDSDVTIADQQLPGPVAETRERIAQTLRACDYDALDAMTDDTFAYTFGGPYDSPSQFWRLSERDGNDVTARMLAILALAPAQRDDGGYIWPALATEPPGQRNVSDPAWQALVPIYDERTVEQVESSDIGYYLMRLSIAMDGTWITAIEGD